MAGKRNIGATLSLKNGNFFTGLKSASSATDSFKSKLTSATSGLKTHGSQLSATGNSLKSLAGKVVGVVAAYASMRQIVSFTKDCISAANAQAEAEKRLEHEMLNVVGASQQQVDGIKKYASELQGLTTVGDEVAISGASQLASFKLQSDTIKTLMPALNDLAVGQNGVAVSQEQMKSAADMVGKAMNGNITTLKKLIPSMTASQQSILKNGTEAERAAVVVDLLKEKYGGLAEAMANTPEGRIQQLKNAWGDMQEVIGAKLYPVITKLLTWATKKIPVVQNMLSGVMDKLQPVFTWFSDSALPMLENAFGGIISIGQSIFDAVAPSLEKLKGAFGTVQNALESAFSNTEAIDNIAGYIGGVISVIVDTASAIMEAIAPILPDVMDIIGTIAGALKQIVPPIGKLITTTIKAIAPILKPIAKILSGIVDILSKTLVPVITFVADVAGGVIEHISGLLSGIGEAASNIWNGIQETTSNVWNGIKDTVNDTLDSVKTAYEEHGGGIEGIAAGAVEGVKQCYLSGYNYLNNLTDGKLGEVLSGAGEKMIAIKDAIGTKWEEIKNGAAEKWEAIKSTYEEHGGGIAGITAVTMQGVQESFSAGYDFINNLTGGKLGEVLTGAGEKMTAIKDAIGTKWEEIKNGAAEKWEAITSSIKGFAQNIYEGLISKFKAVKDGISGIWKGIVSGIKGCINKIIGAVNTMIGGVNKISFDAPDWIPVIGGKKWGFNIPKIPMLAQGGIIQQPGRVIVGERGPEELTLPKGASVAPLDREKHSENINHFDIDININGVDKPLDEAFNEALERLVAGVQLQLANL